MSGSDLAIETRQLTKRFKTTTAVDSLDLKVPAGSAYGFLGPNGAGKTTTIRMLLGLAQPTSGQATVLGEPAGEGSQAERRVGFLPDVPAFYGWMRAPEYLEFVGGLFGIERSTLKGRVGELLELTGLAGVKTRVSGFSRGMKQRLGLAQALVNKPDLLILDEPTSALDPIGRHEVLETIRVLGEAQETTVFFSTHILADVERVCERVGIISHGRLVTEEPIRELKARFVEVAAPTFLVVVSEGSEGLAKTLSGLDWVEKVEAAAAGNGNGAHGNGAGKGNGSARGSGAAQANDPAQAGNGLRITARDTETARRAIPKIIGERGLALIRFESTEPTLEDIFLRLVNEQ